MAVNDIKVLKFAGDTRTYKVDDRDTSGYGLTIKAGEPVLACGNYATRVGTYEPRIAELNGRFIGIAQKESTETATANGVVDVITVIPGQTVLEGAATTVANVDTAAELLTYLNNYILFDATTEPASTTAATITIDENDTSDPNGNGLILIDGSADARGLCDVTVHMLVTQNGNLYGQTMD